MRRGLRGYSLVMTIGIAVVLLGLADGRGSGHAGVLAQPGTQIDAVEAVIVKAEGQVYLLPASGSSWILTGSGMRLNPGDRIKCGPDARCMIRFANGTHLEGRGRDVGATVWVEPGTEVGVGFLLSGLGASPEQGVARSPKGDGARPGPASGTLQVILGRIFAFVNKAWNMASRFEVVTPAATVGVRGTRFAVHVQDTGLTGISVMDGLVAVTAQGITVEVSPGYETRVALGHTPEKPGPMSDEEREHWKRHEKLSGASNSTPGGKPDGRPNGAGKPDDAGKPGSGGKPDNAEEADEKHEDDQKFEGAGSHVDAGEHDEVSGSGDTEKHDSNCDPGHKLSTPGRDTIKPGTGN